MTRQVPIFNRNGDRVINTRNVTGEQQKRMLMAPGEQMMGLGRDRDGNFTNPILAAAKAAADIANLAIVNATKQQTEAQIAIIKQQAKQVENERVENEMMLKNFNDSFSKNIKDQKIGFNAFNEASARLASVLETNPIPNKIELVQNGQVQVLINGAATIAAIKGDLARDITDRVVQQIKIDLPAIIKNIKR